MGKHGQRAGRWVMAATVIAGLAGLGAAAPAGAVTAAPGAAPAAGSWGRAIEVPGLGALNKDGLAEVNDVSCVSPGYCAAGGGYSDRRGHGQGFVASERNGRWGKAAGVPGLQALNTGGAAAVVSVSCSAAGSCAASGYYSGPGGGDDSELFVVSERNGRWGKAAGIPGLAALNAGGDAEEVLVSCGSAGNCTAGGQYTDGSGDAQGFLATERNGRWGKAIEVPGLGALNAGGPGFAAVTSVSCTPAGYCAADGYYMDKSNRSQGFVVTGRNGRWGTAIEVPGLAALNTGGSAEAVSVSCPSAGNCTAGGQYTARRHHIQGFVIAERNGRWSNATQVPGLPALNVGGNALLGPLSCPTAGSCTAGGFYGDGHHEQGFLVIERNGRWSNATQVPGLHGDTAEPTSVSCPSAGNCTAGGFYTDRHNREQGFLITERNGRWSQAIQVPGLGALNTDGFGEVTAVSCDLAGNCAAGGSYSAGFRTQGFVASRSS